MKKYFYVMVTMFLCATAVLAQEFEDDGEYAIIPPAPERIPYILDDETEEDLRREETRIIFERLDKAKEEAEEAAQKIIEERRLQVADSIAAQAAPRSKKPKPSFWIGLGVDAIGAGLIAYGVFENNKVQKHSDAGRYAKSLKAEDKSRNALIIGGAVLLSGISIQIFF